MASHDQEIIKEFLVSLGFHVEPVGARKFVEVLGNVSKLAAKAGGTIASVAVAAEAMVAVFARGMEKMYYASKRTQSSVESLQAVQYAFTKIGLSSEDALSAVEALAQGIRTQPGLTALLNSLGVKTEGRDRVQVLYDTVEQLSKLPHFIGAQWAEQFGIPEKTFLHMKEHLPELKAADEERRRMNAAANLDVQKAAAASREYMNVLRQIWERVEILGQSLSVTLLPAFKEFSKVVNEVLADIQEWTSGGLSSDMAGFGSQLKDIIVDLRELGRMLTSKDEANWLNSSFQVLKNEAKNTLKIVLDVASAVLALGSGNFKKAAEKARSALGTWVEGTMNPMGTSEEEVKANAAVRGTTPIGRRAGGASMAAALTAPGSAAQVLSGLEAAYGLPAGLLDRMWSKESGRGRDMLSPRGAKGHFGFMDPTAREYGVNDPNNFGQAASGAANYMADLLKRYGGNLEKALAAYNWGMGNVEKYGLGAAPTETQNYMKMARGLTFNQQTNINVSGTDPRSTGDAVANAQGRVNADLVRGAGAIVQ